MANCTIFYTYCSTLSVGCYLYSDIKRTSTIPAGYISDGTSVITVNSSGMITAIGSCSSYPVYGTFLNTSCSGYDLYNVYADGYGGTYSTLAESNSTSCGYTPSSTCDYYAMYTSGYVYYINCLGNYQYQYYEWYDAFCARSIFYGPAYQSGVC